MLESKDIWVLCCRDGVNVGVRVDLTVGGITEGLAVLGTFGAAVGVLLGRKDGKYDRYMEGRIVGEGDGPLGAMVGSFVGLLVTVVVGTLVGLFTGTAEVGDSVGSAEGSAVGSKEGQAVGAVEGLLGTMDG